MSRNRLPDRRPCVTTEVTWNGRRVAISGGFGPDGRLGEVFLATGYKFGNDLAAVATDACILISRALQNGRTPEALVEALSTIDAPDGTPRSASMIGLVARVARELAAEADFLADFDPLWLLEPVPEGGWPADGPERRARPLDAATVAAWAARFTTTFAGEEHRGQAR